MLPSARQKSHIDPKIRTGFSMSGVPRLLTSKKLVEATNRRNVVTRNVEKTLNSIKRHTTRTPLRPKPILSSGDSDNKGAVRVE